jgi:hypothetical protein
VLGGLVRALKYMPANSKYRPAWEATFKTFCDTLRIKQQADGFWRTSLFEPTEFPNPESSCTAFFIYAMSLGVQWGILDANIFVPIIRKGWSALVKVVGANGKVGYGQPWSNQPGSPGLGNEIPEGHGAFLLAGEGVAIIVGMSTIAKDNVTMKTPASPVSEKMVVLSETRKAITLPPWARGFEVYNVNGARLWKSEQCSGSVAYLPSSVAKGGICYFKYLK